MKQTIVPGVHDLIPPEGRITVQLIDIDRNKVVKEVKAENLLTDAFKASLAHGGRGDFIDDTTRRYHPGMSPIAGCTDSGFTRDGRWSHLCRGLWPGRYGWYNNWLWTSSVNYTPNAVHTHPPVADDGTFTGHVKLDLSHTSIASRLSRGTIVPIQMWHKWAQSRIVVEFGSVEANGVHRTIGTGSVASSYSGSQASPMGYGNLNFPPTLRSAFHDTSIATGFNGIVPGDTLKYYWGGSVSLISATEMWYSRASGDLFRANMEAETFLAGPNSAAVGGTGLVGVVALGSDLWLTRNKNLMRCVKFTDTTLTKTNTYDHSTTLGTENYLDVTTDGTNLYAITEAKVYVISPATGSITSSWAHGLSGSFIDKGLIEWDPALQHLWIQIGVMEQFTTNYTSPASTDVLWGPNYGSNPLSRSESSATDPFNSRGFTVSGVRTPYQLHSAVGSSYGNGSAGVTGMSPDGWAFFNYGYHYNKDGGPNIYGPSMASVANLGSDIVKTSAQSLKFVYDFNFA